MGLSAKERKRQDRIIRNNERLQERRKDKERNLARIRKNERVAKEARVDWSMLAPPPVYDRAKIELTREQKNAMIAIRRRIRRRNVLLRAYEEALLSKYNSWGLKKSFDAMREDVLKAEQTRKRIVPEHAIRSMAYTALARHHIGEGIPPAVEEHLRMEEVAPAWGSAQHWPEQLDKDGKPYTPYRLPRESLLLSADVVRRKMQAGIDLVGIEPNPGPPALSYGAAPPLGQLVVYDPLRWERYNGVDACGAMCQLMVAGVFFGTLVLLLVAAVSWWFLLNREVVRMDVEDFLSFIESPLEAIGGYGGGSLFSHRTHELIPTPTYETFTGISLDYHAEPVVRFVTSSIRPDFRLMVFNFDDRRYLKALQQPGWFSLSVEEFDQLLLRYDQCKGVAFRSIKEWVISLKDLPVVYSGKPCAEEHYERFATLLWALVGGDKGKRELRYYTTPVYCPGRNGADSAEPTVEDDQIDKTQKIDSTHVENPRDYVTEVAPALLAHPAVFPEMCEQSDCGAVLDRLYAVNPLKLNIPEEYKRYEAEFAELLRAQNKGNLAVPLDGEDVVDAQKTAKTRDRMLGAHLSDAKADDTAFVEAFVKKEAYSSPKDVRNISAINPEHNFWGFRFLLVVKQLFLSLCNWFLPGCTPERIIDAIEFMLSRTLPEGFTLVSTSESDFSRYDGRQTKQTRMIAFNIVRACIDPKYHAAWDRLVEAHFKTVCKTASGITYKFLGSMLSGAFCTTECNTILNAFVGFSALRKIGMTARAAWVHIGLCFGDDALFLNIKNAQGMTSDDARVQVGKDLGLVIEIEPRPANIVSLLSRYYQISGNKVIGSCPDVARMLPKFLSIPRLKVTPQEVRAKMSSLQLLCGSTTPIISDYLERWFRLNSLSAMSLEEVEKSAVEVLPYWVGMMEGTDSFSFPFCTDELRHYVLSQAAQSFGVDVEALCSLEQAIASSGTLTELQSHYLENAPPGGETKFMVRGAFDNKAKVRAMTVPGKKTVAQPAPAKTPKATSVAASDAQLGWNDHAVSTPVGAVVAPKLSLVDAALAEARATWAARAAVFKPAQQVGAEQSKKPDTPNQHQQKGRQQGGKKQPSQPNPSKAPPKKEQN